jgi:hypothetical protein
MVWLGSAFKEDKIIDKNLNRPGKREKQDDKFEGILNEVLHKKGCLHVPKPAMQSIYRSEGSHFD